MSFQLNKSRRKESKRKDGKTFQLVNDETIYISTETEPVLLSCGRHPAWLSRRGIEYLTRWLSLVLSLQLVKFRWVRQWHHHAFLHFHHPVHLGGLLRKSRLMLCGMAFRPRLAGVEAPRVPGVRSEGPRCYSYCGSKHDVYEESHPRAWCSSWSEADSSWLLLIFLFLMPLHTFIFSYNHLSSQTEKIKKKLSHTVF